MPSGETGLYIYIYMYYFLMDTSEFHVSLDSPAQRRGTGEAMAVPPGRAALSYMMSGGPGVTVEPDTVTGSSGIQSVKTRIQR